MSEFKAPTEGLELQVVEFATSLNIPFGEFWYKWFPSSRSKENHNHTIHLECNIDELQDVIKKEFAVLPFVEKIHKIKRIPLPDYCEYKFQYFIHFKMKENI